MTESSPVFVHSSSNFTMDQIDGITDSRNAVFVIVSADLASQNVSIIEGSLTLATFTIALFRPIAVDCYLFAIGSEGSLSFHSLIVSGQGSSSFNTPLFSIVSGSALQMSGISFENITRISGNGAVFEFDFKSSEPSDAEIMLHSCHFSKCCSKDGSPCGAIKSNVPISVANYSFASCTAVAAGENEDGREEREEEEDKNDNSNTSYSFSYGGALSPTTTLVITNSSFISCQANYGGGICLVCSSSTERVSLSQIELNSCTASCNCGGIYLFVSLSSPPPDNPIVTLEDVTFIECESDGGNGGGVYGYYSGRDLDVLYSSCNFTSCHCSEKGGGVYIESLLDGNPEQICMNDTSFYNCTSGSSGSAICLSYIKSSAEFYSSSSLSSDSIDSDSSYGSDSLDAPTYLDSPFWTSVP